MGSLRTRSPLDPVIWGTLSLVLMFCGCSGPKEAVLAPAHGVVKINGAPAANILVQFLPVVTEGDPAPTSTGVSNEAGEFDLETSDGKVGAVVGPCKVLFVDMDEERPPQGVEQTKPPRVSASATIISPSTPQVEVKADDNPAFQFDLKN